MKKYYNLEENVSLYVKDLLQDLGYYNDGNIKVNTLIIFFDYYFNIQEQKNDKYFGTFIRKEQYELIKSIITDECKIKDNHKFYQLLMGAGKSSYIAPLLSLLLIVNNIYPIHIMPKTLFKSAIDNMKILENFYIKNISHEIGRYNIFLNRICICDTVITPGYPDPSF
jgi:hypothetical protein